MIQSLKNKNEVVSIKIIQVTVTKPFFWVSGWNPKVYNHSNESYWAELSCGAVYYAVQGGSNFESVDEILKCDHSNKSYWAELSCGTVYYAVQGCSNFWVCG